MTQNRLDKDHIDTIVLITIMEDIGQVIILSMITPLMAGSELDSNGLIAMVLSIMAFMIISIVVGLRFMPRIINWVSDNVTFEVLLVLAVGMAFGMALLAEYAGLSVAIGAFLMGMMIASSRKNKELSHDIEPMKNILMAMFFISVGMEISLQTLVDNVVMIFLLYLIYAFLKSGTVFLGYWLGNETPRNGFISAVSLVAMGEFAFIIAKQALDYEVVDESFYTSVIGAALISMIALPILSRYSTVVWDKSVETCPGKVMSGLVRLNNARNTFYTNVAASSKRTRREVERLMTLNYVCVLLVILVEILFVLINPAFAEWFAEYIGGTVLLWSVLMLLMNLFGIYLPIYVIVNNLRTARTISRQRNEGDSVKEDRESPTIAKMFMMTSTTMVSMMAAIIVLIVVPNNLGIWEHIIVMVLALAGLFYYNRKSIQKMFEGGQIIETQGTIGGGGTSNLWMNKMLRENRQLYLSIPRNMMIDLLRMHRYYHYPRAPAMKQSFKGVVLQRLLNEIIHLLFGHIVEDLSSPEGIIGTTGSYRIDEQFRIDYPESLY